MHWGFVLLGFVYHASLTGAVPPSTTALRDEEVIVALIESLDDPEGEVRLNLAAALANLGDAAVPRLIDALGDKKPERRGGAAYALSQIRPVAKSAIPALLKAIKDKDEGVRRQVSYALSRIVGRDAPQTAAVDRPAIVPPLDPIPGGP